MAKWLCLVFVTLALPARAATLDTYNVRGWTIGVYSNDKDGAFNHCAASANYQNGITLIFSVNRNFAWSMALANQNWALRTGDKYTFDISVDSAWGKNWFGVAVTETVMEVPLADSTALFRTFKRGNLLTVKAAGKTFGFNLQNSSVALNETLACANRSIRGQQSAGANPFASPFAPAPQQQQAAVPDTSAKDAEAVALLANTLSSIGIADFQILPPATVKKDYPNNNAVWTAPGMGGMLNIVSPGSIATFDALASALVSSDSQTCKGKFVSGRFPVENNGTALRLMTGCSEPSKQAVVNYTLFTRGSSGFYVFGTFGVPQQGATATDQSAEDVSKALLEVKNLVR
ncbi:MAG: hypothetical protein H7X92_01670 [Chitinophagales bacterium]|nr:hypothetical protein [Hyphomicrobiales bacterium]